MKSELSMRGGSNLRYIRRLRGMTVEDLSAAMMQLFGEDLSPSAISKYESGVRPITQEHTAKFAKCLNCSIASLMDGLDLNQEPVNDTRELRMLPVVVHQIFHWVATRWDGNIVALATAWGLYAATPGRYRKYAMMELLTQKDNAVRAGDMKETDIPDCIRKGIPSVEALLGGLYDE